MKSIRKQFGQRFYQSKANGKLRYSDRTPGLLNDSLRRTSGLSMRMVAS
jgi:hypothetical protein